MKDNFLVFLDFVKKLYSRRSIIFTMALREIQFRYAGTLSGFLWTVVNPLMTIVVFWLVFSVGFKAQPVGGFPFVVVFLCALIPWTTFNDTVMASTNAITGNIYLVKKTVFPTEILPVVNFVATMITHSIMLLILIILLLVQGIPFSVYNLQFFYYLIGLMLFSLGFGWICCACNVFYRDTAQVMGVLFNIWFWLTPIVWDLNIVPAKYQFIIKLNPFYYIVQGYKESFLYHTSILNNVSLGVYFWAVCFFFFIIGAVVFRKLKPEFADVL